MKELIAALRKYCNEELDQWDLFKIEDASGPVYITISRGCLYGEPQHYEGVCDR